MFLYIVLNLEVQMAANVYANRLAALFGILFRVVNPGMLPDPRAGN
jgi:hypothetical protein